MKCSLILATPGRERELVDFLDSLACRRAASINKKAKIGCEELGTLSFQN